MKPIAIYGAGGAGIEVLSIINDINAGLPVMDVLGYYDDSISPQIPGGHAHLGGLKELNKVGQETDLIVAIANSEFKQQLIPKILNPKVNFVSLIHPKANIDSSVILGTGLVIGAFTVIQPNVSIADHVYIGCHTLIGHDSVIESKSTIAHGVLIAGGVLIENNSFLGLGAKILPGVKINEGCTVGAGAVVTKTHIEANRLMGVPAKPVSYES